VHPPNPEPLPSFSALAAHVIAPPTPVLGTDKRQHLVYEISLLNVTPVPERVDRVQVLDAANRAMVASYAGPHAIRQIMSNAVMVHNPTDTLPSSGSGVLWLDVSFPAGARVPTHLTHRITATAMTHPAQQLTTNGPRTRVSARAPVALGPPLIGNGYVDVDGCCGQSAHTRALLTVDGQQFLAQRYAIDWVRIDRRGRDFTGTPARNRNWLIFGDPIIAAASGVVVGVLNTLPENTPPHPLAHLTPQNALGNHVIEDLGGGRFALYAHMQTGSVAVKVGQRIQRGEFLGRVGNTGSSTAPHLHFHVTNGPDVIASNGEPYVFSHFTRTGEVENLNAFLADVNPEPARVGPVQPPAVRRDQLPLQADVITFTK
jgi:Peptidase family M23